MRFLIEVTNDYDRYFIEWLIHRVQYELLHSINPKRIRALEVIVNELNLFKTRFPSKIMRLDLMDALITGILSLQYKQIKNYWVIYIPPHLMCRTHFTTICTLCRFVNNGRNDIKGYPIFTKTFNRVSAKISRYYNMYLNEFMIM